MPECFLPSSGDTWLVDGGPGPLNNGRLTHNHLRQGEDSLWPYHLPLPVPKPSERWRETETKRKTKRERGRENYSVNPEARRETQGAIEGEDSSFSPLMLNSCRQCKDWKSQRCAAGKKKKKNLSVGCCTTTPRLRNPSHMLMGCHLAPKSTEGRSEQYPLHYRQSQWSKCVKTEKWPNFSRIQFFLSATQWRMHLATCQGA